MYIHCWFIMNLFDIGLGLVSVQILPLNFKFYKTPIFKLKLLNYIHKIQFKLQKISQVLGFRSRPSTRILTLDPHKAITPLYVHVLLQFLNTPLSWSWTATQYFLTWS